MLNTLIFRIKRLVNGMVAALMIVSLIATLISSAGPAAPPEAAVTQPLNTVPVDTDPGAPKITLCEGASNQYTIVYGQNANRSEVHAALELQAYLETISGASFPLTTDAEPAGGKEIIVGKTNRATDALVGRTALGDDGYRIFVWGDNLVIAGGEKRGTLYGVYAFLEDFLGCRFFTKELEIVPSIPAVRVNRSTDVTAKPAFTFRDTLWKGTFDAVFRGKLRLNGEACPGCGGTALDTYFDTEKLHGGQLGDYVPVDKYLAGHPEYFALDAEGKTETRQLCLTNPDVLKIVIAGVRARLSADPGITSICVTPNDNNEYCKCADCAAIDAQEGSHSGTLIRFVNAVAGNIAADYPGVTVRTLAYLYSRTAPALTKPADNVLVQMAADNCNYLLPYAQASPKFVTDLAGWAQTGCRLFIWDYNTNHTHFNMPYPNLHCAAENLKLYRDNGVTGVFLQGNAFETGGEFGDLRVYIASKLLWDPACDIDKGIEEFMHAYYGPGYKNIEKYMELTRARANLDWESWLSSEPLDVMTLSDDDARQCDVWWDAAEAAADNDGELFRVQRSRIQLRYYKSVARMDEFSNLNLPCRIRAGKALYADMIRLGIGYIHEGRRLSENPNYLKGADEWKEHV